MEKRLDRRELLQAAALAAAGIAFPFSCGPRREPPLNILFILVDDLGWRDLGCFGSTFYETPCIDGLARRGMRFTQAYAACPVCSPTRASILTGKYPARLHATDWFGAPQPYAMGRHPTRSKPLLPAPYLDRMPLEEHTLAEAFLDAGYETFFAGKWHLGGEGFLPEDQGFLINRGGFERGSPPGGYFSPYENPKLEDGPEGEHLPGRLAEEAVRFLESRRKDRPFFLYLSFYSVHTPLETREALKVKYEIKAKSVRHEGPRFLPEGERQARQVQDHPVYAGMVEAMDAAVGRVLEAIDDRTAVVFMSDNGGLSTSEGSPTSNVPLRAGKGWLYEGGIREPMIVSWPGRTGPGSVCDVPVVSTDFYPTLLKMAGLAPRPEQHCDGKSLVPLLTGAGTLDREAIFWHYPHYGNQGGSPGGAVRSGDWKLIEFYEDGRVELYDLREDPGEHHDLSRLHPDKTEELRCRLERWRKEVDAWMPTRNE